MHPDKLPKNPFEALQELDAQWNLRKLGEEELRLPRDTAEQLVVDVWSEVLRIKPIGAEDNFFCLGGDSLRMIQVAARLRELCGIDVSLAGFFDDPTPAGVAEFIRCSKASVSVSSIASRPKEQLLQLPYSGSYSNATATTRSPNTPIEQKDLTSSSAHIEAMVVPTNDRPDSLFRCITGAISNARKYHKDVDIIVAEASAKPDATTSTRRSLEQLAKTNSYARLHLIDARQRNMIIERIASAGIERRLIEFGLVGLPRLPLSPIGANRNLLLLATAGKMTLSLDDDTEFLFAKTNTWNSPVELWSGGRIVNAEPSEIVVYPTRRSLFDQVHWEEFDVIGAHETLLASSLDVIFRNREGSSEEPSITGLSGGQSGKVFMTLHGIAGDCGWGSPSRYLFTDSGSFHRIAASEADYLRATTSRQMLRVSPRIRITQQPGNLMTTAFGIDGRITPPPFVPVGRGSDLVFGFAIEKLKLGSFAHLPWAVLHSPVEQRTFWPGEITRNAATIDLSQMFSSIFSKLPDMTHLPLDESFRAAGNWIADYGAQSVNDFRAGLIDFHRDIVRCTAEEMQDRITSTSGIAPTAVRDLEKFMLLLHEGLTQRSVGIPAELLHFTDVSEAVDLARQLVISYGQMLASWPDIASCALSLRDSILREAHICPTDSLGNNTLSEPINR